MVKRFFKEKKCVAGMIMLLLLILVSDYVSRLPHMSQMLELPLNI